jgi:putative membrane protein
MKQRITVLIGTMGCALLLAAAATAQNANRMGSDNDFVSKAAQGGRAEVELGQLAQTHAASDTVKQFGQRMVTDHTKAGDELERLAAQKGVLIPTGLDPKDQAVKDRLSSLNGRDFDTAYMQDMVKDHRADVTEFQKEAGNGRDAEVKAFAAKTLPVLRAHLQMAEQTSSSLKK